MKKKIVLLVILVISFTAGNALANDLPNPGFELGSLGRFGGVQNVTSWTTVGSNGWLASDAWCGGVHSGTKAVKLWECDTYLYQDISVIAGNRNDFSVWVFAYSGDNSGFRLADAVFKVMWYNNTNALISTEEIGRFYGAQTQGEPCDTCPYDIWKLISGSRTAPSAAVKSRVYLCLVGDVGGVIDNTQIAGSIYWDDAAVNYSYGASNPNPANGSLNLVPSEVTALSWNRPAPRHTGDTIKCDVWFGTDGNMPGTNTKILNKQDANSVAISSLAPHQNYYWRVDCYDPNGSGPEIKSEGQTWTFNTADNCGSSYMPGDINGDCYVDLVDLDKMADNWLKCNDASNPQCQ